MSDYTETQNTQIFQKYRYFMYFIYFQKYRHSNCLTYSEYCLKYAWFCFFKDITLLNIMSFNLKEPNE